MRHLKSESTQLNRSLQRSEKAKQDEFYTQYADIQKEIEAYLEFDLDTFKGKSFYCNCDDPFESNFFKYFAANCKLGLKTHHHQLRRLAHCRARHAVPGIQRGERKRKNPKALAVIIDHVKDEDGDGAANVTDVALFLQAQQRRPHCPQRRRGQPRWRLPQPECVAFLKQADIVVTNPPFSLFRGTSRS